MQKPISLLIIDDSLVFREALAKGLSHEPLITVLPTASNIYDALQKIKQHHPQVIVCDIEMPGMNGIEFIRTYIHELDIPIISLSSLHELRDVALRAGATAFLAKPKTASNEAVKQFIKELLMLIIQTGKMKEKSTTSGHPSNLNVFGLKSKIIAIGASTGGTEAIHKVLMKLPSNCPPILITQHIPHDFSRMFAERLNESAPMTVKEAQHGDKLRPGLALIAPGNKHMRLKLWNDQYIVDCRPGEKVNGHTPSVDVLFDSVATLAGEHAVGILLTGMGRDGATGLLHMRQAGAKTFVQDEESSVVYGMPKAAYDLGAADKQITLEKIAQEIILAL